VKCRSPLRRRKNRRAAPRKYWRGQGCRSEWKIGIFSEPAIAGSFSRDRVPGFLHYTRSIVIVHARREITLDFVRA